MWRQSTPRTFMKKIAKNAAQEPKEESPELLNYRKDLEDIKALLKEITIQLTKLDFRGGF